LRNLVLTGCFNLLGFPSRLNKRVLGKSLCQYPAKSGFAGGNADTGGIAPSFPVGVGFLNHRFGVRLVLRLTRLSILHLQQFVIRVLLGIDVGDLCVLRLLSVRRGRDTLHDTEHPAHHCSEG